MRHQETRLIFKHIDEEGYTNDIDCYVKNGGYEQLKKAVAMQPEDICAEVLTSGVRGRGGAGFPAGMKWKFLDRKSGKPIYLICNADESEPGTFKDRQIIHQDPHQLIEGMMCTAFAIQAKLAFIYIRGEFFEGYKILERAIEEAREKNFLGDNILGLAIHATSLCTAVPVLTFAAKKPADRITRRLSSESTHQASLLSAALGAYQCPTIVNNVETLCDVKHVIEMGGEGFAKIGTPGNTGTRIWCVSGHVQKPGYYEFACADITLGNSSMMCAVGSNLDASSRPSYLAALRLRSSC